MRRIHLLIGLATTIAFVLTGQVMSHHHPKVAQLPAEFRLMYVSRHIYLLGAALVNTAFGLYLRMQPAGWRRFLQQAGSLLILTSQLILLLAFFAEPEFGISGRGWRSYFGMITLFIGVMMHVVASVGSRGIDTTRDHP